MSIDYNTNLGEYKNNSSGWLDRETNVVLSSLASITAIHSINHIANSSMSLIQMPIYCCRHFV